ncbi:MAG: hypothetical protein JRC92_11830 [Deltaproteobacteria bacterium]|nr:hypothetical protein [Deltaproteobacteria bacterium]
MKVKKRTTERPAGKTFATPALIGMSCAIICHRGHFKNRNLVQDRGRAEKTTAGIQDRGRAEKTTAGIYGNILRIGFSALTMRLGQRAFLRWPIESRRLRTEVGRPTQEIEET